MRTAVRETSVLAFHDLRDTGRLGHQQQDILDRIQPGRDYSLSEIVRMTGFEKSAVSGRCHGLKELGLLVEGEPRKCSITGRTINPVKRPEEQVDLFE